MIGIYKITNKTNGKSYIGQSIHCGKRLDEHCKGDQFIDEIIQLDGIQNFIFEILRETTKNELSIWEDYYIIKYDTMFPNGYNKKWNCSKELRSMILNNNQSNLGLTTFECQNDYGQQEEWREIVLSQKELSDLREYAQYRDYSRHDERQIKTENEYKKYIFDRKNNKENRQKIESFPHFYKRHELKFTPSEIELCWFFEDIIEAFNKGVSTWSISQQGIVNEWVKGKKWYDYTFLQDRIVLRKQSRYQFHYNLFKKLKEVKNMPLDNFKFYVHGKEEDLDKIIKERRIDIEKIEILCYS